MKKVLRENGLSIVLFALFFFSFIGQGLTGHHQYNQEQQEHRQSTASFVEYLATGHFIEATFENWESEFLQMGAYIVLTIFLYQKGSSESKEPGNLESVDVTPERSLLQADAPWPVRRGGWVQKLYENSLALAFFVLFVASFMLHAYGGTEEYNQEQIAHGSETVSLVQYLGTSRLWFESFQNWQSEFFSIGAMVVLSIFLRQKGSPESKPVASPHGETGS